MNLSQKNILFQVIDVGIFFFILSALRLLIEALCLPNASSRTIALESTQLLTGIATKNFPGGKGRPAGWLIRLTTPLRSVSKLSRSVELNLYLLAYPQMEFLFNFVLQNCWCIVQVIHSL
jgi:hypothetical protein